MGENAIWHAACSLQLQPGTGAAVTGPKQTPLLSFEIYKIQGQTGLISGVLPLKAARCFPEPAACLPDRKAVSP
ncbi:MAG: hypothetical protein BWY80_01137 [Firmicutes bacterium ADurb.Bin456]|nr:MAG: hypothetical protein BWY80_01137 [Firmicutes bacterium ADurb.Bin456]